ncbi:neuromedin-U isoform X1 [Rattus norvegicus]|uniref:Neuromedin U n=1 Tax=Rattus norvegicus TaxID=10116 RepID=A0A8L2UHE1_RAT|nr:neuromedin-U isoform X1 [Rattus norvegicus]|eukprot:XP_006250934.1 PREDICTED: neuromedin-U isoform X1 [Rattus norvegicus]
MSRAANRRPGLSAGQLAAATASPLLSLLLLLACCADACRGTPISPQRLPPEQELQLWNEIPEACASFLSVDSQPQASVALRKLCRVLMEIFQKPQFLFHYSKTQKLGNSNVVSSVVHPLLQLVPQLHERRMKRYKVNEYQGPVAPSGGFFLFRPRNGKRSTSFI